MNDNDPTRGIDAKTFWRVLGQRATGMTIVTARDEAGPAGLVALSAAHVSADPPTMLVSIDRKTAALATVLAARHFAVNVLAATDGALVDIFGGRAGVGGAARFEGRDWVTLASGAPVLATALGAFDCTVEQVVEHGGVAIVIGRVLAATAGEGEPLVFYRGKSFGGVGEPI
ncbi:flavin reductase family protein [Kaistia geumhonensis]|uniref:Flavin reductase (DIM6/NTAB) family NADH-FMN oxidoreductase RutF n=1 Tax=Kaistia geumhonensis TaxID=410839 RepID=A0ABU0M7Z2_9HYPH|nr:flavin reductase family protein [Kaistia geumhonensis]MCX5477704.1 flavin reductase family protein [Kaistia geumhonensis]MDQ0517087.1 flavin reductase (DIM6/NTAB) family NADH-FMN oxidoreductase RutF [Kaistia geumhonensis]